MAKTVTDSGIELTEKEKQFCEQYVIDWNGTRAAKHAGYSEKTAYVIACENLRKPHIQAYIAELKGKTAELAGVSALRNAQELAKIAYSSAAAMREDWENVKDWDDLTEDEKAIISEVVTSETRFTTKDGRESITRELKYKTYDKQRAIEMLNKMFGWNSPEKHDIRINDITSMSDDELDDAIKQAES